jgi:hypothetical protein
MRLNAIVNEKIQEALIGFVVLLKSSEVIMGKEKKEKLIVEASNLLENLAPIDWISDTDYENVDRALCKALGVKELY